MSWPVSYCRGCLASKTSPGHCLIYLGTWIRASGFTWLDCQSPLETRGIQNHCSKLCSPWPPDAASSQRPHSSLWGNKTDKRQEVAERAPKHTSRRDWVPLTRPSNKVEAHRYRRSVWGHTSHMWQNLKSSPGVWTPLTTCFFTLPCRLTVEKCPLLVTGRCDESRRQRCEARKMERRIQDDRNSFWQVCLSL